MESEKINASEGAIPAAHGKYGDIFVIGYIILLISAFIYALCEYLQVKEDVFTIFWLHYFLCIVYTVILIAEGSYGMRRCWRKENISKTTIAVNLYLISAYALNRELQVFENSVDWLCVFIVVTSLTTLSFHYFEKLPIWIKKIQYFFLGCAIVFYLYLALYVANFYIIGAIGIIALGIGIHILVPVTLFTLSIFLLKSYHIGRHGYYWFGSGVLTVILITMIFTEVWNVRISKIEKFSNQSVMYEPSDLPLWVSVAEDIENDWISQRILKSDLVYTTSNNHFNNWSFMPKSVSWDEVRKHDPLVFIASMVGKCSLTEEDRVKILKAISNGRHQANERLWNGDNLTTSYIVSDVDIYPQLRIAYTEKYLNIKNNAKAGTWRGNTEEGIYTFYLPEGSVITALSLWIDGKEAKGVLTSKHKAAKAYNTIVGVERRDPSVVHWQEGNTVTARVFPCSINEERKFKIGITSPLSEENGQVVYKNIPFDGPDSNDAKETRRVRVIGDKGLPTFENDFEKDKNGDYVSEGKYDPDLKLTFQSKPISSNHFTFDGFTYSIEKYIPKYRPFKCENIFLDINRNWTTGDVDAARTLLNNHKLYTYSSEELTELTSSNWEEVTAQSTKKNFSVFPFYKITNLDHSLVITKGTVMSPHLSDFADSGFAKKVNGYFSESRQIKVFNLKGGSSTYVNSLKELRGLEFAVGTMDDLTKMLSEAKFVESDESNEKIIVHDAGLTITKTKEDHQMADNNAPDHLARLFAYNDMMRKVGTHYLTRDFINEELVNEAVTAYVVSPVSSLIVLETEQDYKRFGIEDSENSLHNAAKQSSGAVPEPHEWALIILFLLFALYMRHRLSTPKAISR